MQLQSGTRLGPYEIVDRVGAGGMGEVYRARDTRLSRTVAIKVLPAEFADDAQLRARFEREAKTISTLNDPHICTLHDVGRENGLDYLVFEYCDGTTLAQRLERGPLPLDQVLQYGIEIAQGLSRAHRAGIVHRDLKPSNIMITKSGIKLLDFGLAKHAAFATSGESGVTTSLHLSEEGTFLGTVAYMAPEVLGGCEADARSDIFALGVVLYEMLTGKPAFSGTSKASVMASILEREPQPVREIQPQAPPALERLIQKCLVKNPDERWESAHDVAEQLRWAREITPPPVSSSKRTTLLLVLAVAVAGLAAFALWNRAENRATSVARFSIPLPMGTESPAPGDVIGAAASNVVISAEGSQIAYSKLVDGVRRIYVRRLDTGQEMAVSGSENGIGPFFSPDGEWIGFSTLSHLWKVEVAGGRAQLIFGGVQGAGRGAVWADDGTIYFCRSPSSGIWKTTAAGGEPERVTEPDAAAGENSHRFPHLLPGGKHLLVTIRSETTWRFDDAKIAVLSLETGKWKVLLEGAMGARYAGGHLLFGRDGALYAAPFDLRSLTVTGPRRKVIDNIATQGNTGAVHYSLSDRGDLVYLPGGAYAPRGELLAVDRAGQWRRIAELPFAVETAKQSPDGRKILLKANAANDDVWMYDSASGRLSRFSFESGDEASPIWTPDGTRVIYSSSAMEKILIKNADGGGEVEEILAGRGSPQSVSPDGSLLAYWKRGGNETLGDLWVVPLHGERKPHPLIRTRFIELSLVFSPSGKWIAYQSNESGRPQVYVSSFPPGRGRWQVSTDGGAAPRWARDEKALFYRWKGGFYEVPLVIRAENIEPQKPQLLFSMDNVWAYDATDEGFLVSHDITQFAPIREINVVLNWTQELQP